MLLLDTDVLIWLVRGNAKLLKAIEGLKKGEVCSISTITIAEIYKNIFPSEIQSTDELIYQHIIYPVDDIIAKQAGFYWQEYSLKLMKLTLTDCLIAATAKINNLVLVSLNTKHFPMKDIKIFNPLN